MKRITTPIIILLIVVVSLFITRWFIKNPDAYPLTLEGYWVSLSEWLGISSQESIADLEAAVVFGSVFLPLIVLYMLVKRFI
jgi:hypothetical protein